MEFVHEYKKNLISCFKSRKLNDDLINSKGEIKLNFVLISTGCPRPIIGNKSVIYPDEDWYSYGVTVHIEIRCPMGMQPSSEYRNFACTNNGTWYREIPYCRNQSKFDGNFGSVNV